MTLDILVQIAGLAIMLVLQFANLKSSLTLRERDREDFEFLRQDYERLKSLHHTLAERVARLEGHE